MRVFCSSCEKEMVSKDYLDENGRCKPCRENYLPMADIMRGRFDNEDIYTEDD